MNWQSSSVLVTGGASFIGSHLVDALVDRGAAVRVVDDLSSGVIENIQYHIDSGKVEFHKNDLLLSGVADEMMKDIDIVFHLAAIHGGRGYIDIHQADCSRNMVIDGLTIKAAQQAKVEKFIFASSGCVYPVTLQMDVGTEVYLAEEMVGPPYEADDQYGWAKLMTELILGAYCRDYGLKSVSCRLFTVYGPRCLENHAVMAFIGRAFLKQNPFELWGDGTQVRNWTYVSDIITGLILSSEKISDASAINLGTDDRIRVIDAVQETLKYTGHNAEINFLRHMPTGPLNRVASTKRTKEILGWQPEVRFKEGLHRTIDWYFAIKRVEELNRDFESRLIAR